MRISLRMNRRQRQVAWVAAGLLILMVLVPPWRYTKKHYVGSARRALVQTTEFDRYRCVLFDPCRKGAIKLGRWGWGEGWANDISVELDLTRLALQCIVVVGIAVMVIVALRTKDEALGLGE